MPSQIRVDKIADLNDSGAVSLPLGGTIPTGQTLAISGNINNTGVSTVGVLSATSANITGIVTATFVGDGSGLTGIPVVTSSKAIAFAYIQQ